MAATCWDRSEAPSRAAAAAASPARRSSPYVLATAFSARASRRPRCTRRRWSSTSPHCTGGKTATIHNAEGGRRQLATSAQPRPSRSTPCSPSSSATWGARRRPRWPRSSGSPRRGTARSTSTASATRSGVIDVSPLDMASAYGVFADRGQRQRADADREGRRRPRQGARGQHQARKGGKVHRRGRSPTTSPTCCGASSPAAPAPAANIGRPGRGQDGHGRELHQRLVRRLHADPLDVGLDGLRRQPDPKQRRCSASRACPASSAARSRPARGTTS